MTETKGARHTPGEWQLIDGDRSIIVGGGPNNDDIAEFFFRDTSTVSITREEAIENARLFIAAPRMLLALEKIAAGPLTIAAAPDVVSAIEDYHELVCGIARAAIAKATQP